MKVQMKPGAILYVGSLEDFYIFLGLGFKFDAKTNKQKTPDSHWSLTLADITNTLRTTPPWIREVSISESYSLSQCLKSAQYGGQKMLLTDPSPSTAQDQHCLDSPPDP